MKKLAAIAATAVATAILAPAVAFAGPAYDEAATATSVATAAGSATSVATTTGSATHEAIEALPSDDRLFADYVDRTFAQALSESAPNAGNGISMGAQAITDDQKARALLAPYGQELYDFLLGKIRAIASGDTTTTTFTATVGEIDVNGVLPEKLYASDLGVTTMCDANGRLTQEAQNAFMAKVTKDNSDIMGALLEDCPYELFWYDKTEGWRSGVSYQYGSQGGETYIITKDAQVTFTFFVSSDYSSQSGWIRTTETRSDLSSVWTAASNAASLVSAYRNYGDYAKLDAYRSEICSRVSYNQPAAESNLPYGNPWQLVWVFDDDPNTTVVCEGYAKAFKYLCDNSDFSDPSLACYVVSGLMASGDESSSDWGGAHMWNIVTMAGNNYMVDVTNCDDPSSGCDITANGTFVPGKGLFMRGAKSAAVYRGGNAGFTDGFQVVIPGQTAGSYFTDAKNIRYYYRVADFANLPAGITKMSELDYDEVETCQHTQTVERENVVAPTCTATGSHDEVTRCTTCNKVLGTKHVTDAALGHDWDAGSVTKAPTCTEPGVRTFTCKRDATHTKTEVIAALGHTPAVPVLEEQAAGSCESGPVYDEVVYCSVCRAEMSRTQKTSAALGHTAGPVVIENEVAATCQEFASHDEVVYCTKCNKELSRTKVVGDTLGSHTSGPVVRENEVAATCTETGYYELVRRCTVCGQVMSKSTATVAALGHAWDAGAVTQAPTCTEPGVRTYTCAHDAAHTMTEAIPALGHSAGPAAREREVAATCTEVGSHDEVVRCSVCRAELSRTTVADGALAPHTAGAPARENVRDDGYDLVTRCTACGAVMSSEHVAVEPQPDGHEHPADHVWDAGTVTKAPTCTEPGVRTFTCVYDPSHTRTEAIAALGHEYRLTKMLRTHDEPAYTLHWCARCGDRYKTDFGIESAQVSGLSAKTYTGKAISIKPVLKFAGTQLVAGKDYTVTFYNAKGKTIKASQIKAAGKYRAVFKGMGLYASSLTKTFTVAKASASKFTVAKIANKKYTGKAIKPAPTVKFNGKKLKKGTDYTVTYKNNKKAGTASILIKGIGNFTGTKTVKFKIVKAKKLTV